MKTFLKRQITHARYCLFVINDANISASLSYTFPSYTEDGLFMTVAPIIRHAASLHRPRAQLNAISFARACKRSSCKRNHCRAWNCKPHSGAPGRSTAMRRLRCGTFGTIQRFHWQTPLQLHSERRGQRAPSVATATTIATFQIITCLLSNWNTHDTCAHCARNTCDLLLSSRYFVRLLRFLDLLSSEASKIFRRLVINTESVSVSIFNFNSGFFKFVWQIR